SDNVHRPDGFDIDHYVREQGEFNYPTGEGHIKLELLFTPGAAQHLAERPLSDDQRIETIDDKTVRLRATVLDTDELLWWLLGFGDSVEVRKPKKLRQRVIDTLGA